MMEAAYRVKREQAVIVDRSGCSLGVSHHGVLRSGGVARTEKSALAALGSYWFSPSDQKLATPDELLGRMDRLHDTSSSVATGNYCFGHWHDGTRTLMLEAEKTGAYSVYYTDGPGRFLAATDVKSLLSTGIDHGGPDPDGIAEYFSFGYIASERTFFKGIKRVPMGHRLIWRDGDRKIVQVWGFRFERNRKLDEGRLDLIYATLKSHLKRYDSEADRFGLTLSGGLDSRTLAAVAKDCHLDFETVSMGPKGSLECAIATQVANMLGVPSLVHESDGRTCPDWLSQAVWLSEGRCPPDHIHYFEGMFAGRYVDGPHILGMLGDAVLGGSNYVPSMDGTVGGGSLLDNCLKIGARPRVYWPAGSTDGFSTDLTVAMTRSQRLVADELFNRYGDVSASGGTEAYRYWIGGIPLIGSLLSAQFLPWTDIIFPFADPELIRLSSDICGADIYERKLQYQLAYRFFPELTKIPRIVDGLSISMADHNPHEYDRKLKRRLLIDKLNYYICRASGGRVEFYDRSTFHRYGRWYRKHPRLREFFADVMLSPQAAGRGLWNLVALESLMHDLRRGKNLWRAVASVLFVELYLQQAMEGLNRPPTGQGMDFRETG
jgi:hypothetical protein